MCDTSPERSRLSQPSGMQCLKQALSGGSSSSDAPSSGKEGRPQQRDCVWPPQPAVDSPKSRESLWLPRFKRWLRIVAQLPVVPEELGQCVFRRRGNPRAEEASGQHARGQPHCSRGQHSGGSAQERGSSQREGSRFSFTDSASRPLLAWHARGTGWDTFAPDFKFLGQKCSSVSVREAADGRGAC